MYRLDVRARNLLAVMAATVATLGVMAPMGRAAIIPAGQSVSMAQLLTGDTIVVGDKVFSNFSYTPNGDMPTASNVTLQGIITGDSVLLQISGVFRDLPGGGLSDAGLGFDVDVTDPLWVISGVRLAGTLVTSGDDAEVHIDELISGLPPQPPGSSDDTVLTIERRFVGGVASPNNRTEDSLTFQDTHGVIGFQSIRVTKDIFADAGSGTFDAARVTTFIQEFDQDVIPEPATLGLAGMSALALVAFGRRRS